MTQRTHKCTAAPSPGNTKSEDEILNGPGTEMIKSEQTNLPDSPVIPPLSQEIKQNLQKLRKAQGRRQFSSRIQNILSRTQNKHNRNPLRKTDTNQPQSPGLASTQESSSNLQPISELQRLCLDDADPSSSLSSWPQIFQTQE